MCMITYRQATFDDVENIHKLLNDYAHEGLLNAAARAQRYLRKPARLYRGD